MCLLLFCLFFFFKQKTAYEMRISDWSSDVCSSDLGTTRPTPLPERVGAKQRICSGPSWRRYSRSILPSTTPSSPSSPAALTSSSPAQRADPYVATLLASRDRKSVE